MSYRRAVAISLSTVAHPIFYMTFVAFGLLLIQPHLFGVNHWTLKKVFLLKVFLYTAALPLMTIIMMRLLKFITTLQMSEKNDRIVPLIGCMVFYLWFYVNIQYNPGMPIEFLIFVLGATIGLSVVFISTIFTKISIHGAGIGGLLTYALTAILYFNLDPLRLEYRDNNFRVHVVLLFLLGLIVSGIVLSSRQVLGRHSLRQIYGGVFLGIISQLLANRILL